MKKILLLFFIFCLTQIGYSQNGYHKFAQYFYSQIDSSKKLVCCDSNHYGFALIYEIPLMEFPYDELDLKNYEERNSDDDFIKMYVSDLVESYNKLKPSVKDRITKSCYTLKVDYVINKDLTHDGLYWVEGKLKFKINFQGEDKNFCLPWWKKILCQFRR